MAQRYEIIEGPGKWDLAVALLEGHFNERKEVTFTIAPKIRVDIVMNGLEREDGSGENWCFKGYARHVATGQGVTVSGFYALRTRKGHLDAESSLTSIRSNG